MPAYIISEVSEVVDAAAMERYRALAEMTIKQYGGRYLVRGGEWESLEGEWALERTIVVEFPFLGASESLVSIAGICQGT
jgi:uncharacterized protein (DUF1330 family)